MYTVIDGFKSGMHRLELALSLPPGTLYTAQNVHITQGGEATKRQDILLLERFPIGSTSKFFGLVATKDNLFTFGSEDY
jgi:hypothetical protein